MRRAGRLASVVALGLLAASRAAAAACQVGIIASLPVTMDGVRPIVPVKINGADARLVADSGAFFSLLSQASAAQFGLTLKPSPNFQIEGMGGEARTFIATIKRFTLAGVDIPKVDFFVGGSDVGGEAAGVLGQNVLSIADVEYDLADGAIRLVKPKDCGGRPLAYWAKTEPVTTVEIETTSRLRPQTTARASVNGETIRVEFDTGASTSILSLAAAKRAGIDIHGPDAVDGGPAIGIGRKLMATWIVPVTSFKLGDEEVRNTRLRVGDTGPLDADMLVGADFFLSHRVFVANSQRKLYFTYSGGPVFNLASASLHQAGAEAKPAPSAIEPGAATPTDAAGFSRRGAALAAREDYAGAIADFDRAVALDPKQASYFYQRGSAHLHAMQPFLAMADLNQAIALAPDDAEALLLRAYMRLSGKDEAGALADLKAADHAAPKQDNLRLEIADLYIRADGLAAAVDEYDLWITAHPGDSRTLVALNGRCWSRALLGQDLDKALTDCNAALKLAPKTAQVLDSRGLVRLRRGDLDGAIADYDATLAVRPKTAWSLYGRGLAKLRKGLAAEGKADLAAAAVIDPALPDLARKHGLAPPASLPG